jgi:hypothetical protein
MVSGVVLFFFFLFFIGEMVQWNINTHDCKETLANGLSNNRVHNGIERGRFALLIFFSGRNVIEELS